MKPKKLYREIVKFYTAPSGDMPALVSVSMKIFATCIFAFVFTTALSLILLPFAFIYRLST